jgi:hypothetical protein
VARRGSPAPGTGKPDAAAGGESAAGSYAARALALVTRHWLMSALVVVGVALRVVSQMAYHPALLYIDSLKYLYAEWPGSDPMAYKVLLKVVLFGGDLATVTVLQHVAGVAMAVVLYIVLLRRGSPRWLAALAAAPVLLDAYELQMEQTIMPDMWFEVVIVAGLAVLLWRPQVTMRFAIVAGLILGGSATVRQVGEIMVLPAAIYLLAMGGGWRLAVKRTVAMAIAFALPIFVYCSVSAYRDGHFWLAESQGSIPGRLAVAADCATLKLSAAVRPLCPTPAEQKNGADWLEHSANSPLRDAPIPLGASRSALVKQFDHAVLRQQPVRVVGSIARDVVREFALTRTPIQGVTPLYRWQYQDTYPAYPPEINLRGTEIYVGVQRRTFGTYRLQLLRPTFGGASQVDTPLATFLRSYQLDGGYAPGPALLLCTLLGLLVSGLALIRRRVSEQSRQLALSCLLFTTAAIGILLVSDVFEFSWRYQLPALVTLPPAGALAIAALLSYRRSRKVSEPEETPEPEEPAGPAGEAAAAPA